MTHILSYPTPTATTFHLGNFFEALKELNNLSYGDCLKLRDGSIFGFYVEKLTDFSNDLTYEECQSLINNPPQLKIFNNIDGNREFKSFAYAKRIAVLSEGSTYNQALVQSIGDELTWINLGKYDHAETIETPANDFSYTNVIKQKITAVKSHIKRLKKHFL